MSDDIQPTTPTDAEEQLPVKEATDSKVAAQDGKPEDKPIEGKKEEAPQPTTISLEEFDKRVDTIKGGHKGTVDKLKQETTEARQKLVALQEQFDENALKGWLDSATDAGVDANVVKTFAERERESRRTAATLSTLQATLAEQETILKEAGKSKIALDLIKTHSLGDNVLEELLQTETPEAMENKALRLALNKSKADARPAEKVDAAPSDTKGRDTSKMSVNQRLGLLMEDEL